MPSFRLPLVYLAVALLLAVGGGLVWYATAGRARIEAGRGAQTAALTTDEAGIRKAEGDLAATREELARRTAERDALIRDVTALVAAIEEEQRRINATLQSIGEGTDRLLALRAEVQAGLTRRSTLAGEIRACETQIARDRGTLAGLESRALAQRQEIARLDQLIAQAQDEIATNPPGRFPERSSFASFVDIADASDPQGRVVISLARGVTTVGRLDIGLLGSLGMSGDAGELLREGGLFANLPLAPRRLSLDLEGGLSQLRSRLADETRTGAFAGATLRLAPLRRERIFLLAGTRYSHEDLGLRLGLGMGRR
jgi:hypothetical protein